MVGALAPERCASSHDGAAVKDLRNRLCRFVACRMPPRLVYWTVIRARTAKPEDQRLAAARFATYASGDWFVRWRTTSH